MEQENKRAKTKNQKREKTARPRRVAIGQSKLGRISISSSVVEPCPPLSSSRPSTLACFGCCYCTVVTSAVDSALPLRQLPEAASLDKGASVEQRLPVCRFLNPSADFPAMCNSIKKQKEQRKQYTNSYNHPGSFLFNCSASSLAKHFSIMDRRKCCSKRKGRLAKSSQDTGWPRAAPRRRRRFA